MVREEQEIRADDKENQRGLVLCDDCGHARGMHVLSERNILVCTRWNNDEKCPCRGFWGGGG